MSDMYYQDVQIARTGTFVDITTDKGQITTSYQIMRVTVEVNESDEQYKEDIITQMWTLAEVSDEGDILDKEYVTVNPDQIDYKFL